MNDATLADGHRAGLEGVIAARTELSMVDGERGHLVYRGHGIEQLAGVRSFEEVAHLLWMGRLPDGSELDRWRGRLAEARPVPAAAVGLLDRLPVGLDPVDVLRTAVSVMGAVAARRGPDLDQAVVALAGLPTVLAGFHRRRMGLAPRQPDGQLGHAASFLQLLGDEEPGPDLAAALDTYLVLLADHGLNASTFTARVIASTGSDLWSALCGAIGALKGPLHGGAPSAVLEQLDEVGSSERVEAWARSVLQQGRRFMGFGHRVYRTYDPRARILRGMAERLNPRFFALASQVEEAVLELLAERHPERPMATNVEFYAAGVLEAVGLPRDLMTPTFALARTAGWTAHVLEQVRQQQAGLERLIRPSSIYVGLPAAAGSGSRPQP